MFYRRESWSLRDTHTVEMLNALMAHFDRRQQIRSANRHT